MKEYKGRFRAQEQIERWPGDNYRTKRDKRYTNKPFRQTARNLIHYDLESIYVPNYKQRRGWGL